MKVFGINSSPHRCGMTARLVETALEGSTASGAEVELIHLTDENLKPCSSCRGGCFETFKCVRDQDATIRSQRLHSADAIIFGTPVYCWQFNGLASLFIDKLRMDTGPAIGHTGNVRPALGITSAGGSGTGCILALQALYRYFSLWGFRGIDPLPVTRFNFDRAIEQAKLSGSRLVEVAQEGKQFRGLGEIVAYYETLPFMDYLPIDELRFIVEQLIESLSCEPEVEDAGQDFRRTLEAGYAQAREALALGNRGEAADYLERAYRAGVKAWNLARAVKH